MAEKKRREKNRKIRNRKNVKFSDKVHPVKGILSFVFALVSLLILILTSYFSFRAKGEGGAVLGLAGFFAFLLSGTGVALAVLSLRQKEIHYRFPAAGGVLCGILLILYLIMYILGTVA